MLTRPKKRNMGGANNNLGAKVPSPFVLAAIACMGLALGGCSDSQAAPTDGPPPLDSVHPGLDRNIRDDLGVRDTDTIDDTFHDAGETDLSAEAHVVDGSGLQDIGGPDGGSPQLPTAPLALPFTLDRVAEGAPVTAAELASMTDLYLDMLTKTRYFEALADRVHGWPSADPKKRYWFGTWWSGVRITKKNGMITFVHPNDGSDNNGLRTGPILEGVCFAHKLWKTSAHETLLRRLIRGLNAWIISMRKDASDTTVKLTRAFYPPSITFPHKGISVRIDYDLNHPGLDNGACEYVHLPKNPVWGDIWVKNKRSKDDIGHMIRAIGALVECTANLHKDTRADLAEMWANYIAWARTVEDDGWKIATWDKAANTWFPPDTLASFILLGNAECDAVLSLRLLGRGDPGTYNCGNGVHPLEFLVMKNDHNGEIVRSFHESALRMAINRNQGPVARILAEGLLFRLKRGVDLALQGKLPGWLSENDLIDLVTHSQNLGIPLTWKDVRWFHGQIKKAHKSFSAHPASTFSIFAPTTPDGAYPFTINAPTLHFRSIALALGSCASRFINPKSKPLLDCARVAAWKP